jgi:hypothetical protein
MPEVVSNTSPLQYLYQLGQLHLLPHFSHHVTIPLAVEQELSAGRALGVALPALTTLSWIRRRAPAHMQTLTMANVMPKSVHMRFAYLR